MSGPPTSTPSAAGREDPALPDPFRWEGWHIGVRVPGGRGLFTTRRGGVSEGEFASMNLSRSVSDDPGCVDVNRERVAAQLALPWSDFAYGRQVHGAVVERVTGPRRGPRVESDGQATSLEERPLMVLAADCLPVVLGAEEAVAVLHGGWRGLLAGVLEEGVSALRDCGGSGPVQAALGPSARGCCYEVGEEVLAHFREPGARHGERNLDLAAVATARLRAAGVAEVTDVGLCTMCHPDLFFSHRRDRGRTGRQAGIAWRGP